MSNPIHNKILCQAERLSGQLAELDLEIHAAVVQILGVTLQARYEEYKKQREAESKFAIQQ